jgi:lipoate-protein ligase A
MTKILKVPDEKFRDKVFKTMEDNLTTMKRELATAPPREEVVAVLKEKFEKKVGRLTQSSLNSQILKKMNQLELWMTSEEFLYKKTPKIPKAVKIREGVEICYGLHKTRGGLIRTAEKISENKIKEIAISGDFTFHPKECLTGLEKSFQKVSLEANQIIDRVENYYQEKGIESPGVESKDFAETILPPPFKAAEKKA